MNGFRLMLTILYKRCNTIIPHLICIRPHVIASTCVSHGWRKTKITIDCRSLPISLSRTWHRIESKSWRLRRYLRRKPAVQFKVMRIEALREEVTSKSWAWLLSIPFSADAMSLLKYPVSIASLILVVLPVCVLMTWQLSNFNLCIVAKSRIFVFRRLCGFIERALLGAQWIFYTTQLAQLVKNRRSLMISRIQWTICLLGNRYNCS